MARTFSRGNTERDDDGCRCIRGSCDNMRARRVSVGTEQWRLHSTSQAHDSALFLGVPNVWDLLQWGCRRHK